MRDTHFRAKYLDSNDFIYGYYVYISNDVFPYKIIDNKGLSLDVDGKTIGQYTGLKDKNGKEIYEGDIIKYNEYWEGDMYFPSGLGQILWDDEDTGFYMACKGTSLVGLFDLTRNLNAEIIGNIYDNPELLEEDK